MREMLLFLVELERTNLLAGELKTGVLDYWISVFSSNLGDSE